MKESVLRAIQAQKVSMRPKIYFTLQVAALVVVACAVLLVSVFIVNFMLFSIRINSHAVLLGFGLRGVGAFLYFFPWALLLLDVALVVLLQWMLRWFRFGYKTPALYLLGGLLVLTLLAGFVLDDTRLNDDFLRQADHDELPLPFNVFYTRARWHLPPGSGVCLCAVEHIEGNTIVARDLHSTTTVHLILPQDNPRATTTALSVGDVVFVAGDRQGDVITAFGLHKLPPGEVEERLFLSERSPLPSSTPEVK